MYSFTCSVYKDNICILCACSCRKCKYRNVERRRQNTPLTRNKSFEHSDIWQCRFWYFFLCIYLGRHLCVTQLKETFCFPICFSSLNDVTESLPQWPQIHSNILKGSLEFCYMAEAKCTLSHSWMAFVLLLASCFGKPHWSDSLWTRAHSDMPYSWVYTLPRS